MGNLLNRIQNRAQLTKAHFQEDSRFSVKFAVFRMIDDLSWRMRLRPISTCFHNMKDQWILDYLEKQLAPVINRCSGDTYCGVFTANAPIWVCWWSGEETAPVLVQQCIRSIRKCAGDHPVHMITEESYRRYLEIPPYILEKVQDGRMCIANFSDYLRASLLAQYGGIWLDATIYCSQNISESYFNRSFFTCKSEDLESRYISRFRWTSFCLAGWKDHVFYRFFKEAMEVYWKQENYAIDYLLVDYLIEIAYRKLPAFQKCMDSVPLNNLRRDELQAAMNAALPAEEFKNIIQADTGLYKLSWREAYAMQTKDKKDTIYSYFLNLNMEL